MNWGQIKIETIKKMFLNNEPITVDDLTEMEDDTAYASYLNGMVHQANEGLLYAMKNGRPYVKQYTLTQFPVENLLGDQLKTYQHTNEDVVFETTGALSYYFEVDNLATIEISINDVVTETVTNTTRTPGIFTAHKAFIDSDTTDIVKITFKGTHPYNYRYVAMYGNDYEYETDKTDGIPAYGPVNKYNLKTLITDFYRIENIVYEDGSTNPLKNTDYKMETDNLLSIKSDKVGSFTINYQAYPPLITDTTADTFDVSYNIEVLILLPLYMASQLYKEDDIQMSTIYRNEFETGLINTYRTNDKPKYTSETGWSD